MLTIHNINNYMGNVYWYQCVYTPSYLVKVSEYMNISAGLFCTWFREANIRQLMTTKLLESFVECANLITWKTTYFREFIKPS